MKKIILKTLTLSNFATFKNQTIDFSDNFNVIVGETGSGKSLIIEALQLIWGNRADKSVIRKKSEYACVEAVFQVTSPEINDYFRELGFPCDSDQVILKRIIDRSGKSKSFVNHFTCKASTLTTICKRFVDLVGQFENQKLLSSNYQLKLLDQYANAHELQREYSVLFNQLSILKQKIIEINDNSINQERRLDYLNYQIELIDNINPTEHEESELVETKNRIINKEKHNEAIQSIKYTLCNDNDSGGVLNTLLEISKKIDRNHELTNLIGNFRNTLDESLNLLNQFQVGLESCVDIQEDYDLDAIISRIDQYQKLKSKFKTSNITGVLAIYQEFLDEREQLLKVENNLIEAKREASILEDKLYLLAQKLHDLRVKSADLLSYELTNCIQKLNMKGASISVLVERNDELDSCGLNTVNIMAETNPGEGIYPIKKIASGGELSRILLSIRKVLSTQDSISIFLFDEIDTGVGGETALTIGHTLHDVSKHSQVIAISHLPQIVSYADQVQLVSKNNIKEDTQARTISQVEVVNGKQNIKNIAVMLNPIH
jgi:DNA repair protein RecN (Recombination protein N)